MNTEAQTALNTILALIPNKAARRTFKRALHHNLKADGQSRPQHCKTTSPTTLSRFFNNLAWDTPAVTRAIQITILKLIQKAYKSTRGVGQVIKARLDLTTLEKTGNFPNLPISVFNAVKGLHIIVLYIGVGTESYPLSYAIWKRPCPLANLPARCMLRFKKVRFMVKKGKGRATLTQLALALLKSLKRSLSEHYKIRALADTAFGTTQFLETCVKHKIHAVTGMTYDRTTEQGFQLRELSSRGVMVRLKGCCVPVWVSWFKLELHGGEFEWRYVVSTKAGDGLTIIKWGRARWAIEAIMPVRCVLWSRRFL